MMVLQWIEDEFSTLDLKDKRRERRAKIIVQQLSSMADSTPDACRDNAGLEATYRFANNDAISPNTILLAHRDAAMARSTGCETVILAQDTTIIDLTKPRLQVKGAGPLESNDKFGYFFHPLYAISEQGVPLGIMDHVTWVREPIRNDLTPAKKAAQRRQACYEEKWRLLPPEPHCGGRSLRTLRSRAGALEREFESLIPNRAKDKRD